MEDCFTQGYEEGSELFVPYINGCVLSLSTMFIHRLIFGSFPNRLREAHQTPFLRTCHIFYQVGQHPASPIDNLNIHVAPMKGNEWAWGEMNDALINPVPWWYLCSAAQLITQQYTTR